ncbi:hypothetical protein COCCU_14170 (plasmid) [Corynebacterium occultum]|uniref:Uncharacterized protein n=1 Tax=Corynebacterium occultum TaxID=2675219 RepID=A0A6B8W597_9CORY|nr:hypothetical protein [Corynebacterium occultum]QGU08724.1 hypothetical protein COCCU_14170 [Corynebacterium occultum]
MTSSTPRARTERALADLLATEGAQAITVARVRATARVDQALAAEVVRQWRDTRRTAAGDPAFVPATAEETHAFEALRAVIGQQVLAGRAHQENTLQQVVKAATEDADQAHRELAELVEKLAREQAATAEARALLAQANAELAALATDNKRLRHQLHTQQHTLEVAQSQAAEARGRLSVFEQWFTQQTTHTPITPAPHAIIPPEQTPPSPTS